MSVIARQHQGFTLIEALLYTTIAASILMTTVYFINLTLQTRVKDQSLTEVEDQGSAMMRSIGRDLRNAKAFTLSGTSTIDIMLLDSSHIILRQAAGQLTATENGDTFVMHSPRVTVDSVSFIPLTGTSTYPVLQFGLTVSAQNLGNRAEFSYSRTFIDSVTLRNYVYP